MREMLSPATLLAGLVMALLYGLGVTMPLDGVILSALYRLRGAQPHAGDILIVAIDEAFFREYPVRIGELDRRFYAQAIRHLTAAGARAVGIDIFFAERSVADGDPDAELAAAIANAPAVLPHVPLGDSVAMHVPYHPLLAAVPRGVLKLEPAAQRTAARVAFSDGVLPSFALAVLERAALPSRVDGTAPQLIDYRGPAGQFPYLSFLSVYRNRFRYSDVQGKVVLLGVTLRGTDGDQILTPFGLMPGVEVVANEVYTLLHGRLRQLPAALYLALLVALALVCPVLALRPRGLGYVLLASAALAVGGGVAFVAHWYAPPLWPALLPWIAYVSTSYQRLRQLDRRIAERLVQLVDYAIAPSDAVMRRFTRGFAPTGDAVSAEAMLASLVRGLGACAGLLLLPDGQTHCGALDDALLSLTCQALAQRRSATRGRLPYHLAEPIAADGQVVGALGLTLPAPPPPHLQALIRTSAATFGQLARYQTLRERTLTYAGGAWPWQRASSLDKLAALGMLEELLAAERGWLGALLESLSQAAFIMTPYGYSIYENAAARRLFAGERNMLVALPKALSIAPERFQQVYVAMVERGQVLELGLTERASGRPLLLSLRVVDDGRSVRGVAGMVSDLSQLEALDRQRRELLSWVAHDLRSPLTSIQGFAELLLEGAESSAREPLQIIVQESVRMQRMIDRLLEVARLEAEGFSPQLAPCDLAEILRLGVASVSAQAVQKGIIITLEAAPFVLMEGDSELLSRLCVNLLSNAIKYSPEGASVTARLTQKPEAVVLEVSDSGYGIAEGQLERLFEKFARGDGESARRESGSGLGLYLCKLIVSAHGGTIAVRSKLGHGSTFTVTLPTGSSRQRV